LTSQRILKEKNFRVWQTILNIYDLYEIENPDPIPNIHYFKRKLKSKIDQQKLSTSPIDTKIITDPSQLNDREFKDWLAIHDPDIHLFLEKSLKLPEDTTHERNVKLANLEKCMSMFNKRYTTISQEDKDREHSPLKEASNFPAIS